MVKLQSCFELKKKKMTLIFSQMLVTFSFMAFGMFNMLKDFLGWMVTWEANHIVTLHLLIFNKTCF